MKSPLPVAVPAELAEDHRRLSAALDRAGSVPCKWDDRFIAEDTTTQRAAAYRCQTCPILTQCRAYGIAHPAEIGTYGGLSQLDRQHHLDGQPTLPGLEQLEGKAS